MKRKPKPADPRQCYRVLTWDTDRNQFTPDELRLRVRAAWWAGFLWATAAAAVLALLAWGVR